MGLVAFGGAMAVVAAIERELVARLRWVSAEAFTEAAAFGQGLPGAIANNALTLLGFRLGGWRGAALLMGGYTLPSFLLMLLFAVAYEALRGVLVVDAALLELHARRGRGRGGGRALAVAAHGGQARRRGLGRRGVAHEGQRHRRARRARRGRRVRDRRARSDPALRRPVARARDGRAAARRARAARAAGAAGGAHGSRLEAFGHVVGVFLATGATTFSGGYVMVPVLERQLVRTGWIGAREFVDAVALGQITPGPVVITSTFVGYRVAGLAGALFGTAAVFAPGFLLALALASSMERVREHPAMRAFLAGLLPAIVGVMIAAAVALARAGLHDGLGWGIAAVAFAVLVTARAGNGTVLIGAALLAVFARLFGLRQ